MCFVKVKECLISTSEFRIDILISYHFSRFCPNKNHIVVSFFSFTFLEKRRMMSCSKWKWMNWICRNLEPLIK